MGLNLQWHHKLPSHSQIYPIKARKRKMQGLWIFLKDNVKCGSKVSDAVILPEKCYAKRSVSSVKESLDRKLILHFRKSFTQLINSPTLYSELRIGDPARNITEMIFQRASRNPSNPSRKIIKVLRVKNSAEIIERFEKYREKVKAIAYNQQKTHPRSSVDGNELMRFYSTTMSCCSERSKRVSDPCRHPACGVCRNIRCNFDTEYSKKNGVKLSADSQDLNENTIYLSKAKTERAVIVCRIIAGTVVDEVKEGTGCIGSEARFSKSESLIVRNPSAILPCFVIVFA